MRTILKVVLCLLIGSIILTACTNKVNVEEELKSYLKVSVVERDSSISMDLLITIPSTATQDLAKQLENTFLEYSWDESLYLKDLPEEYKKFNSNNDQTILGFLPVKLHYDVKSDENIVTDVSKIKSSKSILTYVAVKDNKLSIDLLKDFFKSTSVKGEFSSFGGNFRAGISSTKGTITISNGTALVSAQVQGHTGAPFELEPFSFSIGVPTGEDDYDANLLNALFDDGYQLKVVDDSDKTVYYLTKYLFGQEVKKVDENTNLDRIEYQYLRSIVELTFDKDSKRIISGAIYYDDSTLDDFNFTVEMLQSISTVNTLDELNKEDFIFRIIAQYIEKNQSNIFGSFKHFEFNFK